LNTSKGLADEGAKRPVTLRAHWWRNSPPNDFRVRIRVRVRRVGWT